MVHEIHKRQKIVTLGPVAVPAPTTIYEEPDEQTTPSGYASSILNGNTVQGGLKSVTYKAVNTAHLVENLYLVRNALIKTEYEALRVNDKDYATSGLIEELKNENAKMNDEAVSAVKNKVDDEISTQSASLETQLLQKLLSKTFGEDLISSYEKLVSDKKLVFVSHKYTPFQMDQSKVKAERYEDVQDTDALAAAYTKNGQDSVTDSIHSVTTPPVA